jgi:hypothetical protein
VNSHGHTIAAKWTSPRTQDCCKGQDDCYEDEPDCYRQVQTKDDCYEDKPDCYRQVPTKVTNDNPPFACVHKKNYRAFKIKDEGVVDAVFSFFGAKSDDWTDKWAKKYKEKREPPKEKCDKMPKEERKGSTDCDTRGLGKGKHREVWTWILSNLFHAIRTKNETFSRTGSKGKCMCAKELLRFCIRS